MAEYEPYGGSGGLGFGSGQMTREDGELKYRGRLGEDFSVDEGYQAARLCGLNLIAQAREAAGGDLDRIRRVVKLGGFVNCTPDFTDQPKVMNGASDLMVEVFGEAGCPPAPPPRAPPPPPGAPPWGGRGVARGRGSAAQRPASPSSPGPRPGATAWWGGGSGGRAAPPAWPSGPPPCPWAGRWRWTGFSRWGDVAPAHLPSKKRGDEFGCRLGEIVVRPVLVMG